MRCWRLRRHHQVIANGCKDGTNKRFDTLTRVRAKPRLLGHEPISANARRQAHFGAAGRQKRDRSAVFLAPPTVFRRSRNVVSFSEVEEDHFLRLQHQRICRYCRRFSNFPHIKHVFVLAVFELGGVGSHRIDLDPD